MRNVVLIACALVVAGCEKPESRFLGRWTDGHGHFLDFAQDRQLVIDQSQGATWSLIDDHRIAFQIRGLFGEAAGTACLEDGILKMHLGPAATNFVPAGADDSVDLKELQRAIHTPTGCFNR